MKLLSDFNLKWWQFGIAKVGLIALGIIIGVYWSEFFSQLLNLLWVIFALSIGYLFYLRFAK